MAKDLYILPLRDGSRFQPVKVKLYVRRFISDGSALYSVILRTKISDQVYNTTLCNVSPEAWEPTEKRLIPNYPTSKGITTTSLNETLSELQRELDTYTKNLPQGKQPTMENVKAIVKAALGRPVTTRTVSADYQDYLTERCTSKSWSEKNYLRESRIRRLFVEFAQGKTYDAFSPAFMESFSRHLKESGFHDENTKKIVSSVNGFLEWSRRHGKEVPEGRFIYKYAKADAPIVYLSKEELRKIREFNIPKTGTVIKLVSMRGRTYEKRVEGAESISLVRDFLLFCSLTGLRYSELQMLQKKHMKNDTLSFVTPKTDTPRTVELNRFARSIIDKYAEKGNTNLFLFPRLSNQKANKHLHDLAELCEINEPVSEFRLEDGVKKETVRPKFEYITTHTGRKTFVCQALLAGLSPELVTLWTGHASVDDMRPYMAAASEAKRNGMEMMYAALDNKA